MCSRYFLDADGNVIAYTFNVPVHDRIRKRFNIAPTQEAPVVRATAQGAREVAMLRWGLVPFWAKDPAIGNRMINARAETVAEKPAFRAAYRRRRCLVLADGFYEWHREGSVKIPWYISLASEEPFAFAGLWENWRSKETDESLQTATLITTQANDFLAPLHHRMPVILDADRAERWLAGDDELVATATRDSPRLRAWPVDRRVNNARNEGDELIEPDGDVLEG